MGMSTHVFGIKPPDEKWKQMKTIWDACRKAKIQPPQEVDTFFGGEPPDEKGVVVHLTEWRKHHPSITEWSAEGAQGFEVAVKDLPPDVTILRFYNSW